MKLHYNSVSDDLREMLIQLMKLESIRDFRLVGGTSLALQRGHRRSIDIDLFTDLEYGTMPTAQIKAELEQTFPYHLDLDSFNDSGFGYSVRLGYEKNSLIKVDFFYTEDYIFKPIIVDGIRMADEREIAAMKLHAIGNGAYRQKDYWDVRELLDSYSLREMIQWCIDRHPYTITEEEILDKLRDVDHVKESAEGIDTLKTLDYWELKREEIVDFVDQYTS